SARRSRGRRESVVVFGLFFRQRVALLDQALQLFALLRDPVRVAGFVALARVGRRLLHQLADVVAHDGNAPIELGERKRAAVGHSGPPAWAAIRRGTRPKDFMAYPGSRLPRTREAGMTNSAELHPMAHPILAGWLVAAGVVAFGAGISSRAAHASLPVPYA